MRTLGALLLLVAAAAAGSREELWVLASQDDVVRVFDAGSWRRITDIEVGRRPHGISATADGRTVHVSVAAGPTGGELVFIRTRDHAVEHRVPVGRHPGEIECTPDGRWIYVACADEHYWVVDGETRAVVKRIRTGGTPHNVRIDPAARTMVLSPLGAPRRLTIVDVAAGHTVVGQVPLPDVARPSSFAPDGTRFYSQVDGLLGYVVVDPQARRVRRTVEHPGADAAPPAESPCHGLGVRPDGREIWSCEKTRGLVHVHELESGAHRPVAAIPVDGVPYWVSFSSDGRFACVSVKPGPTADKTLAAVLVAAAAGLLGLLAARRRSWRRRVVAAILCAAVGGGAVVTYYVDFVQGRVAIVDVESRTIVERLRAGHVPVRSEFVRIERAPQRADRP